jgi:hypothetical protein
MARWCLMLLCLVTAAAAASETLSDDERRLAEWIDAHAEDDIGLLAETVNIPSGTVKRAAILIHRLSDREQGD